MKKGALLLLMSLSISFCTWAEDTPLVDDQEQGEVTPEPPTFTKRLEHFASGVAYSVATAASIIAAYKCGRLSWEKAKSDPIKLVHDVYEKYKRRKEGDRWNEQLTLASNVRRSLIVGSIAYGFLTLGIPYINYRYRIPHKALENFKKAFE